MATTSVPLSKIVIDFTLYPRHHVDSAHVAALAEALRCGTAIPPITLDRASLRVVDGVHRVNAYRIAHGNESAIPAVLSDYENEAEIIADAIAANTAHGRNLSPWDRARCVHLAQVAGLDAKRIASLLHMRVERLESYAALRLATWNGDPVPLKRTLRHLAGTEMTSMQHEANNHAGGMTSLFYINQIVMLIEYEAINRENETIRERLSHLQSLIGRWLAVGAPA